MPETPVAFLGPLGTYSHLVAEKRFGRNIHLVPLPTIGDVCAFVSERPSRRGIVPIENSSGGAIYETVDILLHGDPPVCIIEELGLNVRIALLGRKGERITHLYSHFAPMEHCAAWVHTQLPDAERHVVASTAVAAEHAAERRGAACLGNRRLATLYGLDILKYPILADIANLTIFLVIGGKTKLQPNARKTTLAVKLPNQPGSLCTFLEAFRQANVNLSRLISRPLRGCPREYAFLVDIDGGAADAQVRRALKTASPVCVELVVVGSYPTRKPYSG